MFKRLQTARKLAIENNWKYKVDYKSYYDSKVKPILYKEGDLVYLHSPEMLKINRKIQSKFLGPYLLLERIDDHNCIIQNLKTHRTKMVHIHRLRLAKPTSNSTYLGKAGSSSKGVTTRLQQKRKNAADSQSATAENKNSPPAAQSEFVEFDLKNDVIWSGGPLPNPIPIKDEIVDESLPVEQTSALQSQSPGPSGQSVSPVPSPSKITLSKFPSPAKIGQEFANFFSSRPATRSSTREENVVLPPAGPPPDVCPTKQKTIESQAKKKMLKSQKKK